MNCSKFFLVMWLLASVGCVTVFAADPVPDSGVLAASNSPPSATAAPPPSQPAKRSADDLEKLVAPIALYPDPLIATVLPASAYPLEIVQAARFVKDTNNIAKLDEQPWDDNVKAVARFPDVIAQMDKNIGWTSDLGDAFINQSKELMDAVQAMRGKAKESGALKTTPQQVVDVTNTVVTNIVEKQEVYVTNQVVQIQPSQPEVIYVPQYNPTVVYAGYPVAYPGYYYPPYSPGTVAAASIVSFGAGMAMGAWMANGCNWGHGDVDVNVNHKYSSNRDVNRNVNRTSNVNRNANGNGQKWQPDQNRLKNSGSSLSSAQSREARGWGSGTGQAADRAQTGAAANRASTANAGTRGTAAGTGTRAGSGTGTRPSTANAGTRGSSGAGAQASTANRSGNLSATGNRSGSAGATQSRPTTTSRPTSSGSSAFSGGGGSAARSSSARGASSRSGGGGGARSGGGGRGGGGGRR